MFRRPALRRTRRSDLRRASHLRPGDVCLRPLRFEPLEARRLLTVTVSPITAELADGVVTAGTVSFALGFSQPVLGGSTASNFSLKSAGSDGLLGTGDDTTVSPTVSYANTTTKLSFSALTVGIYRLTAKDTITDTAGNKLDGNQDGQPGGNWVRDFVVVPQNTTMFASMATFSSGASNPCCVAAGDFNGDGKPDIVVANYDNGTVGILLSNGSGGFATATTFSSGGSGPLSVAIGDFNGDGRKDLAVANYLSSTVGVLLGNGLGSFAAATTYSTGISAPCSVAVGDFNGDGKADLAVANRGGHTVGVLLGNGSGLFAAATTFPNGTPPQWTAPFCVAVGEFNGDGKADLSVANAIGNTVSVFLGNGSGGFGAATFFLPGGYYKNPYSVAVGDLNGDGSQDLASANLGSGTVGVLFGDGAGGFPAATEFPTTATLSNRISAPQSVVIDDFDGDNKADLARSRLVCQNGGDSPRRRLRRFRTCRELPNWQRLVEHRCRGFQRRRQTGSCHSQLG